MTRRTARALSRSAAVAVALAASVATAEIELAQFGVFYVNGQRVESPYSDNRDAAFPTADRTTVREQAKVTFLIPRRITGAPIVLVPGYGLGSSIYLTTPDRREGWAQHLARAGHPIYVVDLPNRGSSGLNIDSINGCLHGDPAFPCHQPEASLGRISLEQPWNTWGLGPRFGELYPESRFPALPLETHYVAQFAAAFEAYHGGGAEGRDGGGAASLAALHALLEQTGPAVLVLHSAAGAPGYALARAAPALVRAVVAIETVGCPPSGEDGRSPLDGVAFLGIWGDYIDLRRAGGHTQRLRSCRSMADALAAGGTTAELIELPKDRDIRGNSHLMMQDDNNAEIALMISAWLQRARIR